ncbi:cation transporter [Actinomarinicola tropica]|uniref:Heavy metal transport/detoxification protein n=1 Tax=Actinomarinicola tropica TaxID=2789776 RepID=A0A5Q2RJ21_9ACTN|nr:heavy metal-associated domain-containing protein [Actinomarinicola tropica]QGG94386.1 heavy metal transport/detoxification protein [Actinomarinicola tropica]
MTTTTALRTTNLYSNELSCPSCIAKIETRLAALDGVERGTVHFATGRIEVVHDPDVATVDDLVAAVRAAGYAAAPRGFQ